MGTRKLDALAQLLEQTGEDPQRLDIVQRAQRFKRSWVDLAEGLHALRANRGYQRWGYADLHEYCQRELAIKAATVDKLLLSFSTIERHAPEVLRNDGVARPIPTLEATDYFTRALSANDPPGDTEARKRLDAPPEVLDELRSAVFDEGQSVGELRRRFNPILSPKAPETEAQELARKVKQAARRLSELIAQVEGLTEARVARTEAALEALVRDLDALAAPKAMAKKTRGSGRRAAAEPGAKAKPGGSSARSKRTGTASKTAGRSAR